MTDVIKMPAGDDGDDFLVVEVIEDQPHGGLSLAAPPSPGRTLARAQVSLEEAMTRLKPSLQTVTRTLRDLSPAKAEVEFGIKIGGETGVILAKGTTDVNFVIRLTWQDSGVSD